MAVRPVSRNANSESNPRKNNMRKKRMDQSQGNGKRASASGYTVKASPERKKKKGLSYNQSLTRHTRLAYVPWPPLATCSISMPSSWLRYPRTEKMTQDAMRDVTKSRLETIAASMWILLWNLLYDPNIMSPPHEMPSEKNICSAAFLHGSISSSLSHLGMKRNSRPLDAPGNVRPFTNSAIRITYGNVAVK